jgi:ribose/xylose/arabinose/galactoside ABC-type transport system permease subunit
MATKKVIFATAAVLSLSVVSAHAAQTTAENFSQLTGNINYTASSILRVVQIIVTLAGILLAFRGVMHLKQNSAGSPQEKHLSKGIANIVFAAILFIVVPLIHMLVGSLSYNVSGSKSGYAYTTGWTTGDLQHGGDLNAGTDQTSAK